jgi:hypothetical protein
MQKSSNHRHCRQLLYVTAAIWMLGFSGLQAQYACRDLNDLDSRDLSFDIYGCVDDETGAYLPGVRVELKNVQTGEVRVTKANETGFYQFPCPDKGTYDIVFSAEGFLTHIVQGLKMFEAQGRQIDQVMSLQWPQMEGDSGRTTLWIRVRDEHGDPILGATGSIDESEELSKTNCGCLFRHPKPGKHVLRIQKEGYEEKTVPIDVEGRLMNIEVVLRRLSKED